MRDYALRLGVPVARIGRKRAVVADAFFDAVAAAPIEEGERTDVDPAEQVRAMLGKSLLS